MAELMFWGFVLRFLQALFSAVPFILAGLFVTGIFRRLMGRETTVRMFGGQTTRSLLQAWVIGMLLPVCSLGVIPIIRELRRMGLRGGTILAFAMSAPLFNPLSLLYGLTLSEPVAILAFAFCSLIVVTGVGFVWDRLFPNSESSEPEPPQVGYGWKRMAAILLTAAREAGGVGAVYILFGLIGVALLGAFFPPTFLQKAVNGDNPFAPIIMTGAAIPVYATPMLAMSQLGMMFQHGNSPGAAFVLLALGAGMNLGLVVWMLRQYGVRRSIGWFGLLLVIVLGLAYGVDRPLFPKGVDLADHTHAFDVYCRPFHEGTPYLPQQVLQRLQRDVLPYELTAGIVLGLLVLGGVILNLVDREQRLERWLERVHTSEGDRRFDLVIPAPVLGGIALIGLIVASLVGCYAYYPDPEEALADMYIVQGEALGGALAGETEHALYWIDIYVDWSRKLEVGAFLRDWELSEYHRMKARLLREQLEMLRHHLENGERTLVLASVNQVHRTQQRLKLAFLEER